MEQKVQLITEIDGRIEIVFSVPPLVKLRDVLGSFSFVSKSAALYKAESTPDRIEFAYALQRILESGADLSELKILPSYSADEINLEARNYSIVDFHLKSNSIESYVVFESSKRLAELIAKRFGNQKYGDTILEFNIYPKAKLKQARHYFHLGKVIFDSNTSDQPEKQLESNNPTASIESDQYADEHGLYSKVTAGKRLELIHVYSHSVTRELINITLAEGEDSRFRFGYQVEFKENGILQGKSFLAKAENDSFDTREAALLEVIAKLEEVLKNAVSLKRLLGMWAKINSLKADIKKIKESQPNTSQPQADPEDVLSSFTDWITERLTTEDHPDARDLALADFERWCDKHYPNLSTEKRAKLFDEWNRRLNSGEIKLPRSKKASRPNNSSEQDNSEQGQEDTFEVDPSIGLIDNLVSYLEMNMAEEGDPYAVKFDEEAFAEWCKKHYPELSANAVEMAWEDFQRRRENNELDLPLPKPKSKNDSHPKLSDSNTFSKNSENGLIDNLLNWINAEVEANSNPFDVMKYFEEFLLWCDKYYPGLSEELRIEYWNDWNRRLENEEIELPKFEQKHRLPYEKPFEIDPYESLLHNFEAWLMLHIMKDESGEVTSIFQFEAWCAKHYPQLSNRQVLDMWHQWSENLADGETSLPIEKQELPTEQEKFQHLIDPSFGPLYNYNNWYKSLEVAIQLTIEDFIGWFNFNYPDFSEERIMQLHKSRFFGEYFLKAHQIQAADFQMKDVMFLHLRDVSFKEMREKLIENSPEIDEDEIHADFLIAQARNAQIESFYSKYRHSPLEKVKVLEIVISNSRLPDGDFDFTKGQLFENWLGANKRAFDLFREGIMSCGYKVIWEDGRVISGQMQFHLFFNERRWNLSDAFFAKYALIAFTQGDDVTEEVELARTILEGYQLYDIPESALKRIATWPPNYSALSMASDNLYNGQVDRYAFTTPPFELDASFYIGFKAEILIQKINGHVTCDVKLNEIPSFKIQGVEMVGSLPDIVKVVDLKVPANIDDGSGWIIRTEHKGNGEELISLNEAFLNLLKHTTNIDVSDFNITEEEFKKLSAPLPKKVESRKTKKWPVAYRNTAEADSVMENGHANEFTFTAPPFQKWREYYKGYEVRIRVEKKRDRVTWVVFLGEWHVLFKEGLSLVCDYAEEVLLKHIYLPTQLEDAENWIIEIYDDILGPDLLSLNDVYLNLCTHHDEIEESDILLPGDPMPEAENTTQQELPSPEQIPAKPKKKQESELPESPTEYIRRVIERMGDSYELEERWSKSKINKLQKELAVSTQGALWEAVELSWLLYYKLLYRINPDFEEALPKLIAFWNEVQPTYAYSDSSKIIYNQYSTSCPIGAIVAQYTEMANAKNIFEPSAGNGLLLIGADPTKTHANEVDKTRLLSLEYQRIKTVTNYNAAQQLPEKLHNSFDVVVTNPPFSSWHAEKDERAQIIATVFNNNSELGKYMRLEHVMCGIALQTMKDSGKAALVIMGHVGFDEHGRIDRYRPFFNWLFRHYRVDDVITLNSYKLYNKQGAVKRTMLILINGRKAKPSGMSWQKEEAPHLEEVVDTFQGVWQRVKKHINMDIHKVIQQLKIELKP